MDRIEELMEQGRMEEAQELLDMLQQMMENMQMTEGASGQQGQSPGEQAMEGLAETLRDQRGLSDEAFRDLQEQMNPGGQAGESGENTGRDGGAGRGRDHSGDGGEPSEPGGEPGEGSAQSLSERQRALEDELARQRGNLPGAGTPEGEAAREALDRAGRAMDEAADALEQDDIPGALDRQAEAMEALREGMRNLEEGMRREAQAGQDGQQGRLGWRNCAAAPAKPNAPRSNASISGGCWICSETVSPAGRVQLSPTIASIFAMIPCIAASSQARPTLTASIYAVSAGSIAGIVSASFGASM